MLSLDDYLFVASRAMQLFREAVDRIAHPALAPLDKNPSLQALYTHIAAIEQAGADITRLPALLNETL
ncbi:MAG TPA: hypothetical protein VHB73_05665, partial [Alphaproteobacteria bacterium]|nr:hypothetical protein [Alphaproteobacteria bacterium]